MTNTRINYIDNLKGFAIILVVLGHCIQYTIPNFDNDYLFKCIYSMHMPLFMCISGFLSYRKKVDFKNIKKRFVQLVIPFLVWALISALINGSIYNFIEIILYPDRGLWFLWTLFFINLLVYICNLFTIKSHHNIDFCLFFCAIVLVSLMYLFDIRIFSFQFISWYFPFFCIGFIVSEHFKNNQFLPGPYITLVLIASHLLLSYFWMRKEPPTFFPESFGILSLYIYKFFVGLLGIIAYSSMFKNFISSKSLILGNLGLATLGIYAIHYYILFFFLDSFSIDSYGEIFVLFVMTLFLSYVIYIIIKKSSFLSFFLLGK